MLFTVVLVLCLRVCCGLLLGLGCEGRFEVSAGVYARLLILDS